MSAKVGKVGWSTISVSGSHKPVLQLSHEYCEAPKIIEAYSGVHCFRLTYAVGSL